ncbi:hypothetical protein JTB14_011716 [Gonioctena quinquepunctata]|nr:hypothetical protein JTB14_011716 [Gonioctena quinquepunctata]
MENHQLNKPTLDSNNENIGDMPDAKNENEENLNPNAETSCENLTNPNADKDHHHSKEEHDLNSNLIDANEDLQLNPGETAKNIEEKESYSKIKTTKDYLIKRKEEEEAKKKALEIKENKKKAALKRKEEKQHKIQAA